MSEVLAIGLHGLHQDMARMERIAANLANATTPGYKREVTVARPLMAGDATALSSAFANTVQSLRAGELAADAARGPGSASPGTSLPFHLIGRTDDRPGTLKSTGQSLDVAIAGPGYFEVLTKNGPAYTRQGNFTLDARGRLVTAEGHPVMGKGGEIVLVDGKPTIDASGQVFESAAVGVSRNGATPVAQLKVVRFEDGASLQRASGGLVQSSDGPLQMNDNDVRLQQGYLENSNVSFMQEMVDLMQTMRHLESMQKVTLAYDEMLGSAVRKLGELS